MGVKKVFIIGATEYSLMLNKIISTEKILEIQGHIVDKKDMGKYQSICNMRNIELYAFEEIIEKFQPENIAIINAVGYSKMNDIRFAVTEKCLKCNIEVLNYVSNQAVVLSDIKGVGNIILPNAFIGTGVTMGDNNIIYVNSTITHDILIGNNNFFAANVTIGGFVTVGNNCFLGMGSTIKNRISVSDKTLVGSGAYLSHTTNIGDTVVPTRSITLDKNSSCFF